MSPNTKVLQLLQVWKLWASVYPTIAPIRAVADLTKESLTSHRSFQQKELTWMRWFDFWDWSQAWFHRDIRWLEYFIDFSRRGFTIHKVVNQWMNQVLKWCSRFPPIFVSLFVPSLFFTVLHAFRLLQVGFLTRGQVTRAIAREFEGDVETTELMAREDFLGYSTKTCNKSWHIKSGACSSTSLCMLTFCWSENFEKAG